MEKLNAKELAADINDGASWHAQYKDSPHIFVGGLSYDLSEGDIATVFAQ